MPRAFVIRPFGKKKDVSGNEIDFERVHQELIAPALKDAGLGGGTTGEIIEAGNIREDMFALIIEADLVVCDITIHNANTFYELGIRHALRKKHSVLIKGAPGDITPFDLLTDRYVPYMLANPAGACEALTQTVKATLAADRETDSPVFKMLPALRELDPSTVQVIPTDLTEEVGRAFAAKSAGWLRLLASEMKDQRFEWPALRLVGKAQLDLKDYTGAQRSWERIRANDPDDLSASFALSNIYERLYRQEGRPELLELSNQSIARVLRSDSISNEQRSEALALQGRNRKTLWRRDWNDLPDVATRRRKAVNRSLYKAYEDYRAAYFVDLNHYWSGLAALQQGTIALDLANEDVWGDAFESDEEAADYKAKLQPELEQLRPIVSQAIRAARGRLPPDDPQRVWVDISAVDFMFLTTGAPNRVIEAYMSAIPRNGFFAWDAAKGQLELFARLGFKSDLAHQIISTIDALVEQPKADVLEVIIFAGHRIDRPDQSEPRFPADREPRARELIRDALTTARGKSARVQVLASAAPGSDILCHEVCSELKFDSMVCLPMRTDDYARLVFGDLDTWRSRYLELIGRRSPLELSDLPGLPRWLLSSGLDSWERGNRWVLEMAQTRGAKKVTLVALWDGKPTGAERGGTAHMVQIARDAGLINVLQIDAKQLLS